MSGCLLLDISKVVFILEKATGLIFFIFLMLSLTILPSPTPSNTTDEVSRIGSEASQKISPVAFLKIKSLLIKLDD